MLRKRVLTAMLLLLVTDDPRFCQGSLCLYVGGGRRDSRFYSTVAVSVFAQGNHASCYLRLWRGAEPSRADALVWYSHCCFVCDMFKMFQFVFFCVHEQNNIGRTVQYNLLCNNVPTWCSCTSESVSFHITSSPC